MDPSRPDPDRLLARIAASEAQSRSGKLKVFLGAAPGVGKTFAMLTAARDLQKQGLDLVVAIVETHGRLETQALVEGLEVLPRRQLDYKGRVLEELDLDAVLARRPAIALVDELAHSNAPGSRHERRFQDVEEILQAGIDVYTTLNVQHLESLNDVVEKITGVRVRETVPDAFFDRPSDVVLIDLPPRELIERLRQGKVYVPEQAKAALQAFFSPSNLAALRELAMRTAAERIDADLRSALEATGAPGAAPIGQRVLLAVAGGEHDESLVRRARRFADRRQAPWTVAHVESGGAAGSAERLHAVFQLARSLGGETVTLRGGGVAEEILRYAESHGVSAILIGPSRHRPILGLWRRPIAQQLLGSGSGFELTIVDTPRARLRARLRRRRDEPDAARRREYVWAAGSVVAAILVAAALDGVLPVPSLALVFLTAVLVVSARSRTGAGLFAAVASFLAYNFFFTEPRFTLRVSEPEDLTAVLAFLVVAVVSSQLASRLRAQVVMLRAANAHASAMQALGVRLAGAADLTQVFRAGGEEMASALGAEVAILRRDRATGKLNVAAGDAAAASGLEDRDLAVADWVAAHRQPAGRYTATLSGSSWWFVPLLFERAAVDSRAAANGGAADDAKVAGAAGLRFPETQTLLTVEQRQLADAMARQVALAADRATLSTELEAARVESETERLRTALLSSVSHDLRSPLASIIGAASSLTAYGDAMPAADRAALLESIRSESGRLDRYIQNLLDMTRLGSGVLVLRRDWVAFDELLGSAVTRLGKLFPAVPVETRVAAGLPLLYVHPALIEQAIFNILENAAKFSPDGAPVVATATVIDGRLILDITDSGPGIPEEERRRIFDLFYSAERGDRGARGTGLGLTIVRGMIGAHQGKVEARSGPGGVGTTIRVSLPLPDAPRPEESSERE